jgi:Methyltransferase FkbM domain
MSQILTMVRESGLKSIPRRLWYLRRKRGLREQIFRQYGNSADPEVSEVLAFLTAHPLQELPLGMNPPYDWVQQYRPVGVLVEKDAGTGMWVVHLNGHRIFFPRNTTLTTVQQSVSVALMEQDSRSPHCYLLGRHNVDAGDVAVFIGASDGIFCLSVIERLSKAYLFEPDRNWAEPLRKTLEPWGEKVEIVPLGLGSRDASGVIRLDSFLMKRPQPNFVQMDVEGAELDVLKGAENLLRGSGKLRLSICAYHKRLDFATFAEYLAKLGYNISHSPGYYIIGVRMPYLRRGVLYASRIASIQSQS